MADLILQSAQQHTIQNQLSVGNLGNEKEFFQVEIREQEDDNETSRLVTEQQSIDSMVPAVETVKVMF